MRRPERLEDVEARLHLHPEARLEIVEELAADLDALEDELVARGVRRTEARAAALRRLLPDREVVSALEASHAVDRSRTGPIVWLHDWERLAVFVLAFLLIAWLAYGAGRGGVSVENPFVWVELGLLALLIGNWASAGLGLWLGDGVRREGRRRVARRHAVLIVAAFAAGALGTALEAYSLVELVAHAPPSFGALWSGVARVASTAALGLAAPLLGVLTWLSLTPRLIRYERLEARIRRLLRGRSSLLR